MPELPEVETVARLIRPGVEGRRVTAVEVDWLRTLRGLSEGAFRERVVGTRMTRLWRRAKFLVVDLEERRRPAGHLLIHLGMSGRLYVVDRSAERAAHERVRLELDGGKTLVFLDVRKFGRFTWIEDPEEPFAKLGPEPLGEDFQLEWFRRELKGRRRQLKPLLLDQSFVAGLGNIYVDESLHRAGIHPLRRADRLPRKAADRLHAEIRATLAEAIEHEGSSFDTFYRTPEGQPGRYQDQFQVYGRQDRPCRRCGSTIRKLVVGGRGTHLCPRCQRAPRGGSPVE